MVDRYLDYLANIRHLSGNTVAAYRRDLSLFEGFVATRAPDRDSSDTVKAFLADLARRRLAASTINRATSALRGYFRFCQRFEGADANPMAGIRGRRSRRVLPSFLFQEEMERFLGPGTAAATTGQPGRPRSSTTATASRGSAGRAMPPCSSSSTPRGAARPRRCRWTCGTWTSSCGPSA